MKAMLSLLRGVALVVASTLGFCGLVSVASLTPGRAEMVVRSPAEQARGNFGYRVLAISDLTGDGLPEVAVTALHNTDPRGPRGAVFVLNGREFSMISRTDSPYPNSDTIADQGSFGWSIAEASDADNDGIREILVGAIYDGRPDLFELGYGRAYLINPKLGRVVRAIAAPAGSNRGAFFGQCVAHLPGGGGKPDRLLVSAPKDSFGGKVYWLDPATGKSVGFFQAPEPGGDDWFGASLAVLDDLDGDGRADLAVGAGSENGVSSSIGAAYIISGETGLLLQRLVPPEDLRETRFRWSVAVVPDVNGDGKSDVLVGLTLAPPELEMLAPGRACLFSGADGKLLRTLASPEPKDAGWFGWSVAGLPDITGDGAGELLIGCSGHGLQGFNDYGERRVYLLNGATGQLIQTLQSNAGGEGFGLSLARTVDEHGKLRSIIVGAPHEAPAPAPFRSGRVHQFWFSAPVLSASRTAAGVQLSLTAADGVGYQLQRSADLKSWTTLTNIGPAGSAASFLDQGFQSLAQSFYRTR